jgi:hypothetical protein
VDWVLVELRDAPNPELATLNTRISRQAALLLRNGRIVALDGSSTLHFTELINQQLFVLIWHRNHLGIMSANALFPDPYNVYSFDFTTSQGYNAGLKNLEGGIFGMIAGDANGDGIIDDIDHTQNWKQQAGMNGYFNGDFDLNGQVTNQDKNDWWIDNLNEFSKVPE